MQGVRDLREAQQFDELALSSFAEIAEDLLVEIARGSLVESLVGTASIVVA